MLHGAGTGALSLSCIGAVGVNHRVTQLNLGSKGSNLEPRTEEAVIKEKGEGRDSRQER